MVYRRPVNDRERTLANIVEGILESYREHGNINHLDGSNLPARNEVSQLLEDLMLVIFPGYFVLEQLDELTSRYFVGERCARILRRFEQVCLRALSVQCRGASPADKRPDPEIIDEAHTLISPIVENQADLVIGSRISGEREKGAMPPQAIFGNWLSTRLIRMFWQESFTDLGPFRAIRRTTLIDIAMEDTNYGWTVEMQAKCAKIGARCTEVPVSYRKRIGRSKISGTISGSVKAGFKILWTIGRIALRANTNER